MVPDTMVGLVVFDVLEASRVEGEVVDDEFGEGGGVEPLGGDGGGGEGGELGFGEVEGLFEVGGAVLEVREGDEDGGGGGEGEQEGEGVGERGGRERGGEDVAACVRGGVPRSARKCVKVLEAG